MKPNKLAEQYDLLGVSERTMEKLIGPLNAAPNEPVRILVELLCKAARALPRSQRDTYIQQFWEILMNNQTNNEKHKAADFALLPPARLRVSRHTALPQLICPEAWRKLEGMSGLPSEVYTAEILLADKFADFRQLMRATMEGYKQCHYAGGASESNLGYLDLLLSMMHWEVGGGQTYMTTDALDAELRDTPLPADLPSACLMAPYPSIFIAFTESGSSPMHLVDPVTGNHRLQGVFVYQSITKYVAEPAKGEEWIVKALHKVPGEPARTLQLVFMGEGKSTPWDDTYNSFQLAIVDEDEPLVDVIDRHMRVYGHDRVLPDGTQMQRIPDDIKERVRAGIEHLTKVLLYMGSIGAQFEPHKDRAELLKQTKGKKNAAKLAKLMQKVDRTLDYTVLGRGDARHGEALDDLEEAFEASVKRIDAANQPEQAHTTGFFELSEKNAEGGWLDIPAVQSREGDLTKPEPTILRQRRTRWVSSKVTNLRPDLLH